MAKNNINMNQLLDLAVRFPQWQCEDATASACRSMMRADLAVMEKLYPGSFRIDSVKGKYKLAFESDIDVEILKDSGAIRKEFVERLAVVNTACANARKAKKALFDLLPDKKLMELAISDKAQGRGEDLLTACWAQFLLNLGVSADSLTEAAIEKTVGRMNACMNAIKLTRKNSELKVGAKQVSVNQFGLDMWTALTVYLTEGLVTDVLDTNGQFTFVVKDGKKTRKHVQKLFGGQYTFDGVKYVRKDRKDA